MSQEATPGGGDKPAVPGKVVQLPCGYFKDGKAYKDAEIITMTGLTRKSIASEAIRSDASKVTDVILLQCVKRIGTFTNINNKILGDLMLGDRDFLLIEIRRISMTDTVKALEDCPGCSKEIEVSFSLDEIPITPLKDEDFEVVDGQRTFKIQNEFPHVEAVFRFPKGEDQKIFLPTVSKNPIEANFKLYAACLLDWDGQKGPFKPEFFEKLPVNVLDVIDGGFMERQPGPDMRQHVSCPLCASDIDMTFQGSDFLFRPRKRGTMS